MTDVFIKVAVIDMFRCFLSTETLLFTFNLTKLKTQNKTTELKETFKNKLFEKLFLLKIS